MIQEFFVKLCSGLPGFSPSATASPLIILMVFTTLVTSLTVFLYRFVVKLFRL